LGVLQRASDKRPDEVTAKMSISLDILERLDDSGRDLGRCPKRCRARFYSFEFCFGLRNASRPVFDST
jgi:hypothetical protein